MGKASRDKRARRAEGTNSASPAVQRRIANAAAAQRFSPGELAVDEEQLRDMFLRQDPKRLPYLAMATWYLAQVPLRDAKQCLFASTILAAAYTSFGIQADLVALEMRIPSVGKSYGSPEPKIVDGYVNGHVGIIAGDTFLDATAAQFREIREDRGVVPIVGPMAEADLVRDKGGVLVFPPVGGSASIEYRVHPVGSADAVGIRFIEENSVEELARHVTNLVEGFAWAVGAARGKIDTGLPVLNRKIADAVQAASEGKTLEIVDGVFDYHQ